MRTPLISCLMVTQDPNRFPLLRESVACYLNQSYPNKELVVCCFGQREYQRELRSRLSEFGSSDIRVYCPRSQSTLGDMRNESVARAKGDYVCQWDDDDLYHPDRLSLQFAEMDRAGCDVSYLQDQLHLFTDSGELYWVNWYPDFVPNTLLCATQVLHRFRYPPKQRREDGDMRDVLRDNLPIAGIRERGYLYIYTFHGGNTYDAEHHRYIHINHDATHINGRESIVRDSLKHYKLNGLEVKLSMYSHTSSTD